MLFFSKNHMARCTVAGRKRQTRVRVIFSYIRYILYTIFRAIE